jgi:hypothetical protein
MMSEEITNKQQEKMVDALQAAINEFEESDDFDKEAITTLWTSMNAFSDAGDAESAITTFIMALAIFWNKGRVSMKTFSQD